MLTVPGTLGTMNSWYIQAEAAVWEMQTTGAPSEAQKFPW
jgi:hypothetical protein